MVELEKVVPALKAADYKITEEELVAFLDGNVSWQEFLDNLQLSNLKELFQSKEELLKALSHALVRKNELKTIVAMYRIYKDSGYAHYKKKSLDVLYDDIEDTKKLISYRLSQSLVDVNDTNPLNVIDKISSITLLLESDKKEDSTDGAPKF